MRADQHGALKGMVWTKGTWETRAERATLKLLAHFGHKKAKIILVVSYDQTLLSLPSPKPDHSHEAIQWCGCPASDSQRGTLFPLLGATWYFSWPVPVYNQQYIQYSKFRMTPGEWFLSVCRCVSVCFKTSSPHRGHQMTLCPENLVC